MQLHGLPSGSGVRSDASNNKLLQVANNDEQENQRGNIPSLSNNRMRWRHVKFHQGDRNE